MGKSMGRAFASLISSNPLDPFRVISYYGQVWAGFLDKFERILSTLRFAGDLHIRLMIDELSQALSKQWMVVYDDHSFLSGGHVMYKRRWGGRRHLHLEGGS